MDIETCVGCGTTENVWVFGRCTKCWLSKDEAPSSCDGCRYGYLNQQGHMSPGGCLYDDFLKTDSFILPNDEEPPTLSDSSASSQMSHSPLSSLFPDDTMYLCTHRYCHNPVENRGDECGKCTKPKTWTQLSDGYHCSFDECTTCDPVHRDTLPGECKTCQCDHCGDIFQLIKDDRFEGMCYKCKQDVTLSTCSVCSCIFKDWSSLNRHKDLCIQCSIITTECSLCEVRYQLNETNFDRFTTCLKCRMTPPCECGTCIRCENTRRVQAIKLCPCGQESISDLWQQCIDCYYDERKRRFSE
jgi:hypothetical protein